jgi:hypothetical protein
MRIKKIAGEVPLVVECANSYFNEKHIEITQF